MYCLISSIVGAFPPPIAGITLVTVKLFLTISLIVLSGPLILKLIWPTVFIVPTPTFVSTPPPTLYFIYKVVLYFGI